MLLRVLGVVCVLVIGMYVYTAPLGRLESSISKPVDTYYNLLVQGFRDGHLSLKKEVPPGLARLANPYDPVANRLYRSTVHGISDLSYYKGRLYMYFGITPALILFWPFVALTGHYLSDRQAVAIFCAVGVAVNLSLLRALWRRYFTEVNVGVVAACALALGLTTGVPVLLPQSNVYQVAISCGYMLTMLALGSVWCALHDAERRWRWLAAASLAYGLAVGARPNLLFGAVVLLVPVAQACRERRQVGTVLIAATIPITLIGLGLVLYNTLRFGHPFEFGARYQLAGEWHATLQFFSWRYVWFNFRVYFLEPARWSARLPFLHEIAVPPSPSGYTRVQDPFGVLTNIPLVWLALVAPLVWRGRAGQPVAALRWFIAAVALVFGMCVLVLLFYCGADIRYEVDFLPGLVLLAVVGILGVEHALSNQPVGRRLVRCGWSALLGFSVVFNVLVSVKNYASAGCSLAAVLAGEGHLPEAIRVFEYALRVEPDFPEGHDQLGIALLQAGAVQEAVHEFEHALRLKPDYAEAHAGLAAAAAKLDRPEDAIGQYEEALRIKPNYPEARLNLGGALVSQGRLQEAIAQYEEAIRIKTNYTEAYFNCAVVLERLGRFPEAIADYKQALRLKPDYAPTHFHLGATLVKLGRPVDAIRQYEEALRITPDYAEAHDGLGIALTQVGRMPEAMKHWEEAVRLNPDDVEAHCNYAEALEQLGEPAEAAEQYEQALRIKPDLAAAHLNLGATLVKLGRSADAIRQYEEVLRINPDYPEAYYNRGIVLEQVSRLPEAIADYEDALRIKPDFASAHFHLAGALEKLGRHADAIQHYEEALRINPDYAEAHNRLGLALRKMGGVSTAVQQYEEALRINPDYPEAQNNLAWLLATLAPAEGGDPVRAIALAERACQLTDNRAATCLDTLAAAYAAAGRFNDAVGAAQKAIQLANSSTQTQLVNKIKLRLELYQANHAYYEPQNVTGSRTP